MNKTYIELRLRSSFGDIINNYFLFLKYNFKTYINLYLRYNAISIIFTLIASYLLVTGFMGLASRDFRFGMDSNIDTNVYLIAGAVVLVLMIFITSLINYSFSSAYISEYVAKQGDIASRSIWTNIKKNLGNIIILLLIGVGIYLVYILISLVVAFIPLLGLFIQYGLNFTLAAIFGLAFIAIFFNNRSAGSAIAEAWDFTFSNFWNVILYGLVIGILNLMITALISTIPGFIIGIYLFFSIESDVDFYTSTLASIIFTLSFAMFILSFIFSQALSQLAYGILYCNLYEKKYNVYLKEKIEQIGLNES
ncbi:hypothetical protein [Paucihalobacter sp.]|uniref:hypothetical protein n=1 Tax=Paucihalobacter sp. TaxID=2850405 RepID=UPI002FDF17ED